MRLPAGLPKIRDYHELLCSDSFKEMERYSDSFLSRNETALAPYGRKWVGDPFHQWSRQWEYPLVFDRVSRIASARKRPHLRILDAGSGITFFPYYLATRLDDVSVTCVDSDGDLGQVFQRVSGEASASVRFVGGQLERLPFREDSFDVLYSISVLEHTREFARIVREFRSLLKEGGLFVATIDISLDGKADIPISRARELIDLFERTFPAETGSSPVLSEDPDPSEALSTTYIRSYDPRLLPWRPLKPGGVLRSLLRFRMPRTRFQELTCFCYASSAIAAREDSKGAARDPSHNG